MSKRFGRNQRRRMREQVANLEYSDQMNRELLRHQREKIDFLSSEIDDAVEIAGSMSILFPAKANSIDGKARDSIDMPVFEQSMGPVASISGDIYMKVQRLNVLLGRISEDHLRNATHVRVHFGDKQWGYGISHAAIYSTPQRILVNRITHELGHVIGRDLKTNQGATQ